MSDNPLRLRKIHHVELWVGNAKQSSYYFREAFGFSQIAYRGLETLDRQETSFVLRQNKATLVCTASYEPESEIQKRVALRGDSVKDICFAVDDVDTTFAEVVRRGAEPIAEPHDLEDENGKVRRATIATYGDVVHSFIDTSQYDGPFLPGYEQAIVETEDTGILTFDHMVGNVGFGDMEKWANWYSDVLGFERFLEFRDDDISTKYSALMSIVMSGQVIKFPINEPAEGLNKSQIEEYLDYHQGPGVQHIAMLTSDILRTVARLRENGVQFIDVPGTYYEEVPNRVGTIDEQIRDLANLGVLVDRDEDGYLLQLFTQPVMDRPTLFIEIIQRKGSRGFGQGNFQALFESIEREQARRGNL
ncbi:MAG: 4-hydroxyphenylpyruvate dioxygenase [Thermoanaerobaculia bacterium]|nr:4-hydroxyphenylpyruvate dioxygenase [Thermoanaerobaculia bacterium]